MKKYVAVLSVALVLAFAVSAFALHEVKGTEYTPGLVKAGKAQIELGGQVRVRGEYRHDVNDFDNSDTDDNVQNYDQRVRLSTKATLSQNTFGFVELESQSGADDTWTWGDGDNNAKNSSLYIRQAYLAHQTKALGNMSGFKAGHMLLALGNNLFFDHTLWGNDAFILWTAIANGELSYINIKLNEGTNEVNDDMNAHVLAFAAPMGAANVSADLTLLRGHDKTTYDKGTSLYNLGIRGDMNLGAAKVKVDIEKQFGKDTETAAGNENKHSGFAVLIGAEANVGAAKVRLNGAYGSGDDDATDEKDKAFNTFVSPQQNFTYVYDYRAATAAGSTGTGIKNTMYINLGATMAPSADLTVSADLYYLKAAKKMSDTYDSKKIGTELDAKLEYKIDTNLSYYVEGGYLWTGGLYENYTGGDNPDNCWTVRHGVLLTF